MPDAIGEQEYWKLTDQEWETYGHTKWGPNVTHTASGEGELCGPGWVHVYTHPLLAAFLNPAHADFPKPILWRGRGIAGKTDHGLKLGCSRFTTLEIVPLPQVTIEQRIRFGIICTRAVYFDPGWNRWADDWRNGNDRSAESARAAAAAAWAAAWAAAQAAAQAAAAAAQAAAEERPLDLIALAQRAMESGNA